MVAEVTVIGAGIIALSTAAELADRGVTVRLIGTTHSGEASPASAGMLTPTVEEELQPVYDFAIAARDIYPAFLAKLEEQTGISVPLNRLGALRLATSEAAAHSLRQNTLDSESWLTPQDVATLEPALRTSFGAVFSPNDGCVAPITLLDALRLRIASHPNVEIIPENVCNVDVSQDTCEVSTDRAGRFASTQVVLAAGAWSPSIDRSGTLLPIEPVRGQIVAYQGTPLRHVTYGPQGYLVPKHDGHTLAGSTFEHAGFVPSTTDEGLAAVRAIGESLCPSLAHAPISATWAGLRPVTPDLLPIIGRDPESPNVIFACGHGRNGILLAPLTAQVVADLVTNSPTGYDLNRFRPERF